MGLLTLALQSCQKPDTGLPAPDTVKAARDRSNDLGLEEGVCLSCEGFVQIIADTKGPYNATIQSQRCKSAPWIDPFTIMSSSPNLYQACPIEHDRLYKVRVVNMAAFPRVMAFVLANPPYPSISTGSFIVPAMVANAAPGIAEANFSGRISCGCGWLYNCPDEDPN